MFVRTYVCISIYIHVCVCVCVCVCDIRRMAVCSWLDHKLRVFNMRPIHLVGSFGYSLRICAQTGRFPAESGTASVNKVSLRAVCPTVLREVKSGQSDKHGCLPCRSVILLAQRLTQRFHL